ncbi:uncharacterized protein PV07_08535 [Cladophialophora immunda]|uniref:Uncharacterized protein n=1 Tax=Cladophialophora immunda TaxID=569365 RepID=A0A0D2C251_9EURO|nr:uncharacterized protein PV07_08535 [Cladophialophora immunda]KIW25348.1 hypothetical protein PV07_08535 [Cladophialophora immunda]
MTCNNAHALRVHYTPTRSVPSPHLPTYSSIIAHAHSSRASASYLRPFSLVSNWCWREGGFLSLANDCLGCLLAYILVQVHCRPYRLTTVGRYPATWIPPQ